MARALQESDGTDETVLAHLGQVDHWTFLLALVLVTANIFVVSPYLSMLAAAFLLVALCYDAWEFYREDSAN